jgi:uncharacterized membrane protein YebE (DUF533 family)
MTQVAESVARWMGILSTGLLMGAEAEQAAVRAQRVLGAGPLAELRRWFAALPDETVRDAKCAVIEACISIVHADGSVGDAERELIERMIQLSDLDPEAEAWLNGKVEAPGTLDEIVPRLTHTGLRELVLVMAWQLALADGHAQQSEHGAYGVLADRLGVAPGRASELRSILKSDEG